jgi:hypothetical protein
MFGILTLPSGPKHVRSYLLWDTLVSYCTIHLSPNPGRALDVLDFDEIRKNRKNKKAWICFSDVEAHACPRHNLRYRNRIPETHDGTTCFFVCDADNFDLVAWLYGI